MNKINWILIAIVFLFGCEAKEVDPPGEIKIYFSGITNTDINGVIVSTDTTDWRMDDTWSMKESDLFSSVHQPMCSGEDVHFSNKKGSADVKKRNNSSG